MAWRILPYNGSKDANWKLQHDSKNSPAFLGESREDIIDHARDRFGDDSGVKRVEIHAGDGTIENILIV